MLRKIVSLGLRYTVLSPVKFAKRYIGKETIKVIKYLLIVIVFTKIGKTSEKEVYEMNLSEYQAFEG
jgi:hypothetical protein